MLHDTAVHYADAAGTTRTTFEVAPDLAADAITEWLEPLSEPVIQTIKRRLHRRRPVHRRVRCRHDEVGLFASTSSTAPLVFNTLRAPGNLRRQGRVGLLCAGAAGDRA